MKKVAKVFFIIGIVCLLVTVIFAIFNIKNASNTRSNLSDNLAYEKAKAMYNYTGKYEYKEEMEDIKNKNNKEKFINNVYTIGLYAFGGITIALFTTGIVIKIKEKRL